MRRTAVIGGVFAALMAGSAAWADEPTGANTMPVPALSAAPVQPAPPTPAPAEMTPAAVPNAPAPVAPAPATAAPSAAPTSAASTGVPSPPTTPPQATAVQPVAPEEAEAILGQRVIGPDGTDVGRLVDVLVDASGQPQAAVIDFGGFMGVGNRKVAVHWSALRFSPSDPKRKIALEMTLDQVKTAPEFRNSNKPAPVVTPADPAVTAAPDATAVPSPAVRAAGSNNGTSPSAPGTSAGVSRVPATPSLAPPADNGSSSP